MKTSAYGSLVQEKWMLLQIKIPILFLFSVLLFGCIDDGGKNGTLSNHENAQNQKTQKTRFLFNAISLLGRTSPQVEKVLGKPYLETGESKSYPALRSRWLWYKYEKDLSIFFDRDQQNDIATSMTLIFRDDPKDAVEAAWILGIDLNGRTATVSDWSEGLKQYTYLGLHDQGKAFHVNFWEAKEGEDTIKIGTD